MNNPLQADNEASASRPHADSPGVFINNTSSSLDDYHSPDPFTSNTSFSNPADLRTSGHAPSNIDGSSKNNLDNPALADALHYGPEQPRIQK